MLREALLWASENPFLAERLPRYPFVQRAVRRFMPGETPEAAMKAADRLQKSRMSTVFTLLGENIAEPEEAVDVVQHYHAVLEELDRRDLDVEISVKLTQLGVDLGRDLAAANLDAILSVAERLNRFVWIDIEASGYVDVTLDIYKAALARFPNTGLCLQSYLYRTAEDLGQLLPLKPAIRLVKGAYAEPADVAFPRKRDVDSNYLELSRRLLDVVAKGGVRAAFATHDEALVHKIKKEAATRGIARGEVEFQMLYGIGTSEQVRLAGEGYKVEVLISYGSAWFPWYVRRLAERPANLWFVVRKMVWS